MILYLPRLLPTSTTTGILPVYNLLNLETYKTFGPTFVANIAGRHLRSPWIRGRSAGSPERMSSLNNLV